MNFISRINKITRMLNNLFIDGSTKLELRNERIGLMKKVLSDKNFNRKEELFLLPMVHPDLFISADTAIVGNSVRLKRGVYGETIDDHRNVVRFNYAPTVGFEKHSGGVNDIRVCGYTALKSVKPENHPDIKNTLYDLKGSLRENRLIVFYKKGFHLKQIEKNKHDFLKNGNKIHYLNWDRRYFNDLLDYLKIQRIDKDPQCGTGLMLLLVDLFLVPDVYGLDKKYCDDNFFYYWDDDNKKCESLSKFHNYDNEFRIPQELIKKSLIKYF